MSDSAARSGAACIGVVLAGGASRRFGSDKAMAVVGPGQRVLLEVALEALAPWCAEVIVVRAAGLPPTLESRVRRVVDGGAGPLQALRTAFEAVPAERWLVAACDLPRLKSQAFIPLLKGLAGHDVACFVGGEGLDPLVAAYSSTVLPALQTAAGSDPQPSLRALLTTVNTRVIEPTARERACLWNANRREDLAAPEEPP